MPFDRSILYTITTLDLGGAEAQVALLADGLSRQGWHVAVASLVPPGAYTDTLEAAGVVTTHCDMRLGRPDPRGVIRLRRFIRSFRPDVVHSHLFHATIATRLALIGLPGPRLISTSHNVYEGSSGRMWTYRVTDRATDCMTSITDVAADAFLQAGATRQRPIVVPNGIDLDRFRSTSERRVRVRKELGIGDEFMWLSVGNLVAQKRFDLLIDAFRPLQGTRLVLVGDGPERNTLGRAAEGAAPGQVTLLGRRTDVPDLLNAADGFVLSSDWEGLPVVLLEAAAAGLPLVATDVGGCRDVVADGDTGTLVNPGSATALTAALQAIMTLPAQQRIEMGRRVRARAEKHFGIDQVLERWKRIYVDD